MSVVPEKEPFKLRMQVIKFPGFEVSYVGAGPSEDSICFGSSDGQIMLTAVDSNQRHWRAVMSASREAVNGVAFIGNHISVSTRNEVSVITMPPIDPEHAPLAIVPAGAHHVIASRSGEFVAPAGNLGVHFIAPDEGATRRATIYHARDREVYYYRVAEIVPLQSPAVLVFATRLGGVCALTTSGPGEKGRFSWKSFRGFDVVDVCPLGTGLPEPSACAVGKDGTLVLFRDVVDDRKPAAFRLDELRGTAYRVFSARGHLFLLTSAGLYVLGNLVSRFLAGEPLEPARTSIRELPAEVVDGSLLFDRYVFVVTPDETLRLDLDCLDVPGESTSLDRVCDSSAAYVNVKAEWKIDERETAFTSVE